MPTEEPVFFVRTKICKKAVLSFGLFHPSEFFILHPRTHPSYGENQNRMTWSQDGTRTRDLSAVSHRTKYQLFHLTYRKNWWLRLPSLTWVCLYHFSIFFWKISHWSNVNLVLNQTILSFKAKKLLTTYLSPLIFLNYKKQNSQTEPTKNDSSFRLDSNQRDLSIPDYKSGAINLYATEACRRVFF